VLLVFIVPMRNWNQHQTFLMRVQCMCFLSYLWGI